MSSLSPQHFELALFRLPFRPFFLIAALYSIIAISVWGGFWLGWIQLSPFGGFYWWHSHEMIFGFASAVLVGFLLTAAKNWTGLPGVGGWPLILLTTLWLIPRLFFFQQSELSLYLGMSFEAGFWLLACYFYSRMILQKRMWRNLGFSFILLGLGTLSMASIWMASDSQKVTLLMHSAIMFFALVMTIIGGRIIPLFTSSATGVSKVIAVKLIEFPLIVLTLITLLWSFLYGLIDSSIILACILLIKATFHLIRFFRWPVKAAMQNPMLWSLYLGYACLIIGVLLLSAYHFGLHGNLSATIHMYTIGAIGLLILTMTSRVSFGHTGRKIKAPIALATAFLLLFLAAIVRSIAILFFPEQVVNIYAIAAALWVFSYSTWLYYFMPILVSRRADGLPG